MTAHTVNDHEQRRLVGGGHGHSVLVVLTITDQT